MKSTTNYKGFLMHPVRKCYSYVLAMCMRTTQGCNVQIYCWPYRVGRYITNQLMVDCRKNVRVMEVEQKGNGAGKWILTGSL